jgi:hypothetical protein
VFNELEALVGADRAGFIPDGLVYADHPRFGEQPGTLRMISVKSNIQLNNNHSLMARLATQKDTRDAVTWVVTNDFREQENSNITAQSLVAQHSWVMGNSRLNQVTFQVNHMNFLGDSVSNISGEHYIRDFPNVGIFPPRLAFPSVNTGAGGNGGTQSNRYVLQFKDDFSVQSGAHSIKMGVNYNELINLGIVNANEHFATLTFFDDPSVILSNRNGRYPQGFQTPGIVRQWQQANGGVINGDGYLSDTTTDARQFGTWLQDDWRVTTNLTLNLGVRYDTDFNLMDQENHDLNATRIALEAIGHPAGGFPSASRLNISPRVGFAYDLSGDGGKVVRGGYGLYFDQYNTAAAAGDITAQGRRPLNALATLTNTAIGVGALASYRFGVDPLPAQPTEGNSLPRNSEGQWLDTDIGDPRTHQLHIGYAHSLAENTAVHVDYTHVEGRNEMRQINLNPIVNGTRVLAPDFQRVLGAPNYLSAVYLRAGINKSRYDALTFRFQRRFPRATVQAHYTLAGAYSYGASTGNRSGAGLAQDQFNQFADSEWGPNGPDERHRFVATGVFEIPWGVQLSPVVQLASARPYNLTAGTDLNGDGTNNDRWVDPATGQQVSINAARGDNTFVFDMRSTKFISLGAERRLGFFAEFFNIFNTANFGGTYQGNGRAVNFRQPTGFIPGIGYPRQVQLGMRLQF